MIRAFVAIELSPELRAAIAQAQAQLKDRLMREIRRANADVRIQWVRPDSIHLTLKFLGNVAEDTLADIESAMHSVVEGRTPFSLEAGGLGVFPHLRSPRVVWIGLSGAVEQLTRLAGDLDAALGEVGFAREPRLSQPHLTLGRIKERSREVGRALSETGVLSQGGTVGTLAVNSISLMKSDLRPSGAVYTRLFEAALRAT